MASATKKPLARPMKMHTIPKTRTSPLRMLFTSSSTLSRISVDWSMVTVISTPSGRPGRALAMTRLTFSVIVMTLSPDRFLIFSVTAGRPSTRESVLTSLKPSRISAMSRR